MTDDERRQLKNFDAKVRQLISQFNVMKQENADLYTELDRKEAEIESLKVELAQSKRDYSNLKLAKMMQISDSELKDAKQRITRLVREVNKCIGILSTEFS
jgi:predicted RNase H-like nuclease (RuvC/YqgF family)